MPAVKKLNFKQRQVLESVARGTPYADCNSPGAYRLRDTMLWNLKRRGLVRANTVPTPEWVLTADAKSHLSVGGAKSILLL